MPRKSKKPPGEPRHMNILLPWDLHQRLVRMAASERRPLRQQIIVCLEESLALWEQQKGVSFPGVEAQTGPAEEGSSASRK